MSELLKIAMSQYGVKEVAGGQHNQRIVDYAKDIGMNWVNDDETPWCSIFVNWVCKKAGVSRTDKANARSWVHIGKPTQNPSPGDVVVFWRESPNSWKGHVGFFVGFSADRSQVFCLGGNQGNAVGINAYDVHKVLRYRKLSETQIISKAPKSPLKRGDRKPEVFQLQVLLNRFEYHCGDPDGDYGQKTEGAIEILQADHHFPIDGKYKKSEQKALDALLNSTE